jgi:hypothetical protein
MFFLKDRMIYIEGRKANGSGRNEEEDSKSLLYGKGRIGVGGIVVQYWKQIWRELNERGGKGLKGQRYNL